MDLNNNYILTINGGSSSIKFGLYPAEDVELNYGSGAIENIGTTDSTFRFVKSDGGGVNTKINVNGHADAIGIFGKWLNKNESDVNICAIGHRIVHGMKHTEPEDLTHELLDELKNISCYDPEHLPAEIDLVEILKNYFPEARQIACFDTSFHSTMPLVAQLLPVDRKYLDKGVRRYGFHGLSYSYLLEKFALINGEERAKGKIIVAHLGNGASIAALREGKSVDTSMGFTPASGLPMSSRTGDLDPGFAWYVMRDEKLNAEEFNSLINHESGLLGISGISSDLSKLLNLQSTERHAAEAVDYFCYQVKKWIGAYAAVLGGLDEIIFSGGIGFHLPEIRKRICDGLEFLGIIVDPEKNQNNDAVISTQTSTVIVHVMQTNEELVIARAVRALLK